MQFKFTWFQCSALAIFIQETINIGKKEFENLLPTHLQYVLREIVKPCAKKVEKHNRSVEKQKCKVKFAFNENFRPKHTSRYHPSAWVFMIFVIDCYSFQQKQSAFVGHRGDFSSLFCKLTSRETSRET